MTETEENAKSGFESQIENPITEACIEHFLTSCFLLCLYFKKIDADIW